MRKTLDGKIIAITGCTGGLGRELCIKLACENITLVMLDRNLEKSEKLANELIKINETIKIIFITVDLEDIDSVKKATQELIKIKPNVFIHNAGAYKIPRHICKTGYDNIFQINFVSPYYIVRKLQERNKDIKIVSVGSIAHTYSKINENDIDLKTQKSCAKAYGNAKRFLMLSLHEFFKNTDNLSIVHPGITFTNITNHYPKLIFAIIKYPMKIIFMKPKKAVLSIYEGVKNATPYGYWIGPGFFDIWGSPKIKKISACFTDDSIKAKEISEKIYKNINNTFKID